MSWLSDLNKRQDVMTYDQFVKSNKLAQLQQQQAGKKKDEKNFLTDQISTGGGIGGALAGGAAGAAVGSVVPVVGTAVGGLIGAVLGGGLGSAGGEIAENKMTGQDWDKNVLKEGLIGGATSLPIGAGFKLARAGVKAGTGVGKKSAGQLVEEAGISTVGKKTAAKYGLGENPLSTVSGGGTSKVGKQVEDVGAKLLNSQTQVTGAQGRKFDLKPTETMKSVNARTGLTSLDDMAEVSRGLTGAGDDSLLDTLTRAAVDNTTGVDVGDLRTLGNQLIDNQGTLLSKSQRTQLLENVKNASTAMRGGSSGSLSTLANPGAALDQANKFRSAARTIQNKSISASPEQDQMAVIYSGLAKQIEDSIYKAPGVSESIPMLVKSGADDLLFRAQDLRAAGNAAQADAYEKVAQELRGVKDMPSLRKMKRDFVSVGKMDDLTAQVDGARSIGGADLTSSMRNPINLVGMGLDQATPGIGGRIAAAGRALQGRAGTEAGQATAQASRRTPGQGLVPLTARQGITRAVLGDGTGQDAQQGDLELEAQMAALSGEMAVGDQTQQAEEPNIGGVTKSQLEQGMEAAMRNDDSKAFAQLKAMYEMLPEPQEVQKLNATTAALAAKQATGGQVLDQLEAQYGSAGGGQGLLGNVTNVAGNVGLNASAAAYNDQLPGTARLLSRAMGEVGAGSDSDAQAYISMLPRLTDTPEQARQKIAMLRERLATSHQNTMAYGAGAIGQDQAQLY